MLSELSVENFAIIDSLRIRFDRGFIAVTGETGAGKSIIIDALHSALGARTGSDVVRDSARYAAIEAVFEWPSDGEGGVGQLLAEYGIDEDDCLVLRREIGASGRGSARINGRTVPVSLLSSLGSYLVDIHGQSDHLSILKRDRQLDVLDRYGGLGPLRAEMARAAREYALLRGRLDEMIGGRREREQRLDLLRFQVSEIETANVLPDEEDELESERHLLSNAERLTDLAGSAYESLQGDPGGVLDQVARTASSVRDLADIDPGLGDLAERVQSAQVELEDAAQELRAYRDAVEFDPRRLGTVEERLDLLTRLKRKYGPTLQEVIAFGQKARSELDDVEHWDDRVAEMQQELDASEQAAGILAAELSQARAAAAESLADAMRHNLAGLGLRSTNFHIELTRTSAVDGLPLPDSTQRYAFTQSGIDAVTFQVSFNPGEPLRPLDKVASGGETSRFLLALKTVLAGADRIGTLIFDEVDVGVGGKAGTVVGEKLHALSRSHQVISITHLPQVAALADHHLRVVKSAGQGRTTVEVEELSSPDRVVELAEMMSGGGSDAARRSARELLEAAQQRT